MAATDNNPGGVRLSACLPLRVKQVSAEAADRRRTAVLTGPQISEPSPGLLGRHDPTNTLDQLVARVETLEAKIDQLLALVLRDQQRAAREDAVSLELHRSGVRFRWPEPLEADQVLEGALTLGLIPPVEIFFLAQVSQCAPEPATQVDPDEARQYLVQARFTAITEDHRDAIHRFIITAQRQQRRTDLA